MEMMLVQLAAAAPSHRRDHVTIVKVPFEDLQSYNTTFIRLY